MRKLLKTRVPHITIGALALLFIVGSYLVYAHFGYVSAPGGDLYNHGIWIRELSVRGIPSFLDNYPKFFHLLVLIGMKVSRANALQVMLAYVPLVVVSAGLVAAAVLTRLRGAWAGVLAFILVVLVARQPLQTLYDGGFPNFISVSIWMPMVLFGVALQETGKKMAGAYWMLAGTALMLTTHHFSSVYLIILLGTYFVLQFERRMWRYLLLGVIFALLFIISPWGSGVGGLLGSIIHVDGTFPWVHLVGRLDNPNALIPYTSFPSYFTRIIWYGGVLTTAGVVLALALRRSVPRAVVLTTVLALVLVIASQIEAFRFPLRLGRDAGVPLALLTAYGLSVAGEWIAARSRYLAMGTTALLVAILGFYTYQRVERLVKPEPTMQYTPAQERLLQEVKGERIVVINQYLPTIAHPNAVPVLPEEMGRLVLVGELERAPYALLLNADPFAEEYREILADEGFYQIREDADTWKSVILFAK